MIALVIRASSAVGLFATNSAPVWNTTVAQNLTVGVAYSLNLDTICSDPNLDLITYTVQSGSLPAGITQSGTRGQLLSGTPTTSGTLNVTMRADDTPAPSGGSGGTWAERSVAAGVMQAIKPTSQAEVTAITFLQDLSQGGTKPNGWTLAHTQYDTSQKASGAGSIKFNCLNADGTDNGAFRIYLKPDQSTFGPGQNFYVQWRQRMPSAFCRTAFYNDGTTGSPIDVGKGNGFKQIILAQYSASNVGGSIVMENSRQMSCPLMYYYDTGGSTVDLAVLYGGWSYRFQTGIDNNPSVPDPGETLTGTAATLRYGPMYNATPVQTGTPDPNNGGYVYQPDEWQTFMIHVRVGTWGGSNTLVEAWAAGEDEVPRLVHKRTNLNPGQPPAGGYQTPWFLPYCTARTHNASGAGFDTATWYDELLTATIAPRFPGGYSVTPS